MTMLFVLPEELIHLRDLVQYEEPSPDDSWAGWSVMLAIQVSAEHGDPQHRLLQGWRLLWRVPGMVRMAIQCLHETAVAFMRCSYDKRGCSKARTFDGLDERSSIFYAAVKAS
jgi:hypothetical protein